MDRRTLAQMFLVGFRGESLGPNDWIAGIIGKYKLGGVLLFDKNIDGSIQNFSSPASLKLLVRQLKQISINKLFIAVDQEGGNVSRLKKEKGFLATCSAEEMSQGGEKKTREQAALIAQMLETYGINLNFAPVVDINLNAENPIIAKFQRSFGTTLSKVAQHASYFIKEHGKRKIGCCIKHFPGHGSSSGDSHKGFVDITECWQEQELAPYKMLVSGGYNDGIMTGHLVNKRIDESGLPATLSSKMVYTILREQLGFTGVIFSDDLQMSAITHGWSYREAVKLAVLAGVDVLVAGNNLQYDEGVVDVGVDAIEELIDSGAIGQKQVEQSIVRIEKFKERINY